MKKMFVCLIALVSFRIVSAIEPVATWAVFEGRGRISYIDRGRGRISSYSENMILAVHGQKHDANEPFDALAIIQEGPRSPVSLGLVTSRGADINIRYNERTGQYRDVGAAYMDVFGEDKEWLASAMLHGTQTGQGDGTEGMRSASMRGVGIDFKGGCPDNPDDLLRFEQGQLRLRYNRRLSQQMNALNDNEQALELLSAHAARRSSQTPDQVQNHIRPAYNEVLRREPR